MQGKTTEELLAAWRANDRNYFTDDAFAAIADLLGERGVAVPAQAESPQFTGLTLGGSSATNVVITDIRVPFWSMVDFMVKWAIASIPAAIILALLIVALAVLLRVFVGGF
jgi:hypothetical protein